MQQLTWSGKMRALLSGSRSRIAGKDSRTITGISAEPDQERKPERKVVRTDLQLFFLAEVGRRGVVGVMRTVNLLREQSGHCMSRA
jgi:hypothetical protein